ncbi:MAG: alpha/beta hydrolase [Prevotella sp.]
MRTRSILLTAFLSILVTAATAQEGAWTGKLSIQGIELPLVFHFDADGCTMDSPSQGAKGIKAEKTITADGKIRVAVPTAGISYEGTLDGDTIRGTFKQMGLSLPLNLTPGQPKHNRPQTPQAPFPYKTEEVTFTNDGFTFHGTLTLPEGMTPETPVVLMVTGSGQQNRDEELFDHRPFAVIADYLARNGIASLRYDDRGLGDTSVRFTDYTTTDFKHDAEAALTLLRGRFGRVGVLGHSEGGTIALMLAAERKPDFIVSMAGMVISGKETILSQNRYQMRTARIPDEIAEKAIGILSEVFDKAAAGEDVGSMLQAKNLPPAFIPVIERAVKQVSTPYIRNFMKIDVRPLLPSVVCPVLALNGTLDMQVDSKRNLEAINRGLTGSKHETVEYESLNHLFQHCKTGSMTEYNEIEETIAPEALAKITSWIKSL